MKRGWVDKIEKTCGYKQVMQCISPLKSYTNNKEMSCVVVVGSGVGGFKATHHKLFMSLNKWNLDF